MNLFISNNFIDTFQNKVKALQVIKQISDDDELIHSEVIEALAQNLNYSDTSSLIRDIRAGEIDGAILQDEELYVNGEFLQDIFDNLHPGDYTGVAHSLAMAIDSLDEFANVTLRLDHNCLPIQEAAPAPTSPFTTQTIEGERREVQQPIPFPDVQEESVFQPEVAPLESEAVLGVLTFRGRNIGVVGLHGKGLLFDVESLYFAIYGVEHDQNYLRQLIVEMRDSLGERDLHIANSRVLLTSRGLNILHSRLCYLVEWQPMVLHVVNTFTSRPTVDTKFDLLGNLEG